MNTNIYFEKLHNVSCRILNVNYENSFIRNRKRENVEARQMTMFIMSSDYYPNRLSLNEIGNCFYNDKNKGYDHATVLHAKKTIENLINKNYLSKKGVRFKDAYNKILLEFLNGCDISENRPFDNPVSKKVKLWSLLGG